jgi:hypothetical protein
LCLYHQVSTASTLNFVCIIMYPQLHTQFCLYQQVSVAPTLISICISKYPQSQP